MNKHLFRLMAFPLALMLSTLFSGTNALAQVTVTIGSSTGTNSYFYGPIYRSSTASSFNYSRYAYVYTSMELGIPSGAIITKVEWLKANSSTLTGNNTFNIWMENSSATTLTTGTSWGTLVAGATPVYSSTAQQFTGAADTWESYTLTPFTYTGSSLKILTDHVKTGTASGALNYYVTAAPGLSIGYASGTAPTETTTLSTSSYGNNRPTIRITYTFGAPCSGTPAAPVASASITSACAGVPFTLSATGLTPAGGVSYQWQSRPAGATSAFVPMTGATAPSYTVPSQTAATEYQLSATCTSSGGGTIVSNIVTVNQSPGTSCYCTPIYSSGCSSGDNLDGFTLIGEGSSINHTGTGCSPGSYGDYTTMSVNLFQGFSYPGVVTTTYTGTYEDYRIWIDFNDNGLFESSESLAFGTGIGDLTPGNFTLSIPPAAPLGSHRMRVRLVYSSGGASSIDPCASVAYGETHDYTVNIIAPSACTGTPVAGITSSVSTVCSGIPFMLTATPNGMTGYTYLFESNTGTGWTALGTASPSYTYSVPSLTTTTQYRVTVTCSGGGTNTSGAITVTQSPGSSCYCTPVYTYGCSSGDNLDGFTLVGEGSSISHTGTGCSPGSYGDYTSMSVTLFQGFNYPGTVTTTYSGTYEDYRIWIDFNDNGYFESSESMAFGTGIGISAPGNFTLNIPPAAPTGAHRMRVRLVYSSGGAGSIDPCASVAFGETHDYTVNIASPAPCAGTPVAGITSSITTACVGVPFTLTATPNGMTGYTYAFEKNEGTGWVSLGAASPSFTYTVPSQTVATQYRVIVTCTSPGGGSNTSAAITVAQTPATSCYCTPTTSGGTTYYISNFITTGGMQNISKSSGSSVTGYQDFHATDTASAMPGTTINYNMTVAGSGTYGRGVWIDLNADGAFQASEQLVLSSTYESSPLTGSFTIPMGTTPGPKRMRIIASWTPSNPTDPCINAGTGEYEDYTFVVIPLPPCTGTPVAGTATAGPAMICSGGGAGLSLTGYASGVSGISIQWESASSATGPFTPIPGATGATYNETGITAGTFYRAKVTCGSSSLFSYSDTVSVSISNPVVIDSLPGMSCTPGPITLGATPGAGSVIEWYDAPTAGSLLGTGNTYTTPSITTTTTYYAQAVAVIADDSVGLVTCSQNYYMSAPSFMNFDAFTAFELESVQVYPYNSLSSPTGTITISLEDAAGTVLATVTEPVTGTMVPVAPVTIMLNFSVPAGSDYKLNISSTGIDGYLVDENPIYPYTLPGVVSITDGYLDVTDVFYWGTYNWRVKASCTGPRVPVTATIGGVPVITAEPVGDTLCVGQALTLTVGATGAATYQWYGPMGAIPGATGATYTIPSVTLAAGGDYSVEVNGPAGCGSTTSSVAHVMIGSAGQWMGFSDNWNDAANWCGGVPTATSDIIIPAAITVPFEPIIATGNTGAVRNISIMSSTVTANGTLSIYGDATATAGGALDAVNGTITLAGAAAQNINVGFNAQNLNSNGGGEKTLGNDVIVTGNLALNSSVLNLGSNLLTLWPGATVSGGAATSYVKTGSMGGLRQEVGATAARFPVGKSAYNPATITNTGEVDNITIRVRDEVLSSGYSGAPLVAPTYVVKRTWDIEEENSGGSMATVTLQWNAGEENSPAFDYSHVYIAHYTDGDWQNTCCASAEMAPAAAGAGPYTVTQSGIATFSPFTVASAGGDPLIVPSATPQGFSMKAYPNPASNLLTVKVEGGKEKAQVSLTDVTGRELMARFVENGKASFELQGLSDGVYFVKYTDGRHVQTLKVNKH